MTLTHNALYDAFKYRASMIHELITFSYSREHLGVSEESITEMTLVELERTLAPHLITRKFNKHEEFSDSGADWLWTIGRPGRWFSLLIQAKLARPGRKDLRGLHHNDGGQLAQLIAYAREQRCLPLYAVYNNHPAKSSKHSCSLIRDDPSQIGSVLVRTRHVVNLLQRKRGKTNVKDLLSESLPWACIFGCPENASASQELADIAAAAVAHFPMPADLRRAPSDEPLAPGEAPSKEKGARLKNEVPQMPRELLLQMEDEEVDEDQGTSRVRRLVAEEPRQPMRVWHTNEPDDFLDAPQTLISERPPRIVEEILRGGSIQSSPVAMVSIISSEPILMRKLRA